MSSRELSAATKRSRGRVLFVHPVWDGDGRAGGGELYATGIVTGLARSDFDVHVVGCRRGGVPHLPTESASFVDFSGRRKWRQAASAWPTMVSSLPVSELTRAVNEHLKVEWDAIVLSHLSSAWALHSAVAARESGRAAFLAYASQNIERDVWTLAARSGSLTFGRRLLRMLDRPRVTRAEERMLRMVDLATCITAQDAQRMRELTNTTVIEVSPGRDIPTAAPARSPTRSVLILGSLRWELKVANLVELLSVAEPAWSAAGIQIVVAGPASERALADLRQRFPETEFHGEVADTAHLYEQAGVAVIHEPLGGGFKMKTLDYLEAGIHIAFTSGSAAGLSSLGDGLSTEFSSLDELVREVPRLLDEGARSTQSVVRSALATNMSPEQSVARLADAIRGKSRGSKAP